MFIYIYIYDFYVYLSNVHAEKSISESFKIKPNLIVLTVLELWFNLFKTKLCLVPNKSGNCNYNQNSIVITLSQLRYNCTQNEITCYAKSIRKLHLQSKFYVI